MSQISNHLNLGLPNVVEAGPNRKWPGILDYPNCPWNYPI